MVWVVARISMIVNKVADIDRKISLPRTSKGTFLDFGVNRGRVSFSYA